MLTVAAWMMLGSAWQRSFATRAFGEAVVSCASAWVFRVSYDLVVRLVCELCAASMACG